MSVTSIYLLFALTCYSTICWCWHEYAGLCNDLCCFHEYPCFIPRSYWLRVLFAISFIVWHCHDQNVHYCWKCFGGSPHWNLFYVSHVAWIRNRFLVPIEEGIFLIPWLLIQVVSLYLRVESDILRPHLHKYLQRIKEFSSVILTCILQNSNPKLVLHSAIV